MSLLKIAVMTESKSFPNYIFIEEGENPLSKKARKVIIDGIEYRSVNSAASILGIDNNRLDRMLKSDKFINYIYV